MDYKIDNCDLLVVGTMFVVMDRKRSLDRWHHIHTLVGYEDVYKCCVGDTIKEEKKSNASPRYYHEYQVKDTTILNWQWGHSYMYKLLEG